MPPQVYHLWPDEVRTAFGPMSTAAREGDTATLARGCRRVEAILKRIEAGQPRRPVRLQVARSHFDLSFFYKDLGRLPAAGRSLERARDRWQAAVKSGPGDFYARTQLGACHNQLGLLAADADDPAAAKAHYAAALDARDQAHARATDAVDSTDVCDNLTYGYGTLVNLAHVHRTLGEARDARHFYATAVRELKGLIPKHRKKADRELCEFFARQWEFLHGQPHYGRMAARFLDNAQWGRAELAKAARPPKGD